MTQDWPSQTERPGPGQPARPWPGPGPSGPVPYGQAWNHPVAASGGPGNQQLPPPQRRRRAPWLAAAAIVALAAVVAGVVVMSRSRGGGGNADPTSSAVTSGAIRPYPSQSFSTDPQYAVSRQQAQRTAQGWVDAVNNADVDKATSLMCRKDKNVSGRKLFGGIKVGSIKAGEVSIRGKKGSMPVTLTTKNGNDTSTTLPMVLEDSWKVCLP